MNTISVSGKCDYLVGKPLGGNSRFSLYRASSSAYPDQDFILKIAKTIAQNPLLEREAFILSIMNEEAKRLEEEYARVTEGKVLLNYQVGFPMLAETFLADSQDNRRVIIASLSSENISNFVSLSMVRERDRVRVDPKTSAWIMGKLLKILAFCHNQNIINKNISGGNVLIERGGHLVTLYDWSTAAIHNEGIPIVDSQEEIKRAAREVIRVLGGNIVSGEIPSDEQLVDDKYQEFLIKLLGGSYSTAKEAHSRFYEVVEALWGRKFHSYASYPL